MNVITRGVKNTLRSPVRSGAIILMFAMSIALILSMLVARSSVLAKINEVKATAGTSITIRPAGVMGEMGGGNPLTAAQLKTIQSTTHITATTMTLTDQLDSSDTSLTSSLEFGGFGRRSTSNSTEAPTSTTAPNRLTPGITVTGTTDANSITSDGGALALSSGNTIDMSSSDLSALVGTDLASKNNLKVNDTFTAYGKTFTVKGIYTTGNRFQDSGLIIPLATLQSATNQPTVVSSVIATVDSSDNVSTTVTALKTSLGSDADITSEVQRAEASVSSLEGIASLALAGVVAAAIAGAVIILLAMIMVVRERRREIGVMKAIGGTNGKVIGQFITEGFSLTVFGAVIGIILGVLVSGPMTTSLVSSQASNQNGGTSRQMANSTSQRTVSSNNGGQSGGFVGGGFRQLRTNATQITASLTPSTTFLAIGVTLLISLIGTVVPAWFTARIRPAEVLRTE